MSDFFEIRHTPVPCLSTLSPLFHLMPYGIYHLPLFQAPQRRHETVFVAVPGESVHYDLRGKPLQTSADRIGIFIKAKWSHKRLSFQSSSVVFLLRLIYFMKSRSPDNMEHMYLYPAYFQIVQILYGPENHLRWFPRKTHDHMGDHRDADLPQIIYTLLKNIKRISSVYKKRSFLMNRLKSQFYPYKFMWVSAFQFRKKPGSHLPPCNRAVSPMIFPQTDHLPAPAHKDASTHLPVQMCW